jgi:copper chaperone CopZ
MFSRTLVICLLLLRPLYAGSHSTSFQASPDPPDDKSFMAPIGAGGDEAGPVRTVTLKVPGMSCPGCAHSIEKKIREVNGVKDVKCDVRKGLVRVECYVSPVSIDSLRSAVRRAGYSVRSVDTTAATTPLQSR